MLSFKNGADQAVIVLHEIYGINRHISEVCTDYHEAGYDVWCPDLLGRGRPFDYADQRAAYRCFVERVGFERAARQVTDLLSQLRPGYRKLILVGYSVGATVAFLCASAGLCDLAVGYYGSRIRDYTALTPACPALLIFAQEEPGFDVGTVASLLGRKKNTVVRVLPGGHGFCDPYAGGFCPGSAEKARQITRRFLSGDTRL